jgi:glutathione S-transferase
MNPVTLFGLERSVYTRIARLALEEKGVAYTLVPVEIFGPEGVPAEHRHRHPFGRIPVLAHGGFQLYETGAVTRYVDEAFDGPALQPREAVRRARMNQVIGILDSYAYRPMVWGVFVERVRIPLNGGIANEATIAQAVVQSEQCAKVLAELLGDAPHFGGAAVSLADLHAYPMLRIFSLAAEGRAVIDAQPALARWLDGMQARPSVRGTRTRYEPG